MYHLGFKLTNEHTHIMYLIDTILYKDTPLHDEISPVRNYKDPNGNMNNFEVKYFYLLPHDSIVIKWVADTKRSMAEISVTSVTDASYL